MDVGEERAEGEEIALGEGVELVVMALGAAGGLAEPGGPDRPDAVVEHTLLVILGLRPAFLGRQQQSVEARTDPGLAVGVRQQVARDLFEGEAVEGFVLVETADDVVAVGPDIARGIAMVADGVGVADHIQPADGHALAVVRRGQQAVDELRVGVRRLILDEGFDFLRGRRQAEQVGMEATRERPTVGFVGRREALRFEARFDERVDGLDRGRHGRFDRRLIGPMVLILRSFGDPTLEELLLFRSQLLVRFGRRHDLFRIGQEQPLHQFARRGVAGDEGLLLQRVLPDVQAQLGLAVARVVAVAIEAVVREDRPDVAVEFDGFDGGRRRGGQTEEGEGEADAHGVTRALEDRTARGKEGKGGCYGMED